MNLREARLIREIKKRCTYRRLAEIYYTPTEDLSGLQFAGEDLCEEAFSVLYPNRNRHEVEYGKDPEFDEENKSYLGDFYWWE